MQLNPSKYCQSQMRDMESGEFLRNSVSKNKKFELNNTYILHVHEMMQKSVLVDDRRVT